MCPIERETKLVVSPRDYREILRRGEIVGCLDQLNIYYHDPHRLEDSIGYLRIRLQSGEDPVATLKIPAGWKGQMREMVEVERPLSELGPGLFPRPRRWVLTGADLPEGFMEHFRNLGITRLRRLGWMRNHRCVIRLGSVGTFELDRTELPNGKTHFEVEIEHPSEDRHQALVEEVRSIAPSAEFTRVGKFTRFMEASGLA